MNAKLTCVSVAALLTAGIAWGVWCTECTYTPCVQPIGNPPPWESCGAKDVDNTVYCQTWLKRLRNCKGGGTAYDTMYSQSISSCLPSDIACF